MCTSPCVPTNTMMVFQPGPLLTANQAEWRDLSGNPILGAMTIGSTASKCSAQSFIFDGTNAYATSAGVTNQ